MEEVERLIDIGWSVKDIVKKTNLCKSTVYNVINKLKREARYDFKNLMHHDYLWLYQRTLENLDKTIRQCNDQITAINVKYDEIEKITMDELEATPEAKNMVRSTLITSLISIQSNRTNELSKLLSTRDKASETKARLFNQGPVVFSINEWINSNTPPTAEPPHLPELEKLKDEDYEIQQEMMDDIS